MYNRPEECPLQNQIKTPMKRKVGRQADPQTICQPTESDVLCGKDKRHAKHDGNKLFRDLIESNVLKYTLKKSKQEKMKITKEIVATMQNKYNSRFLKPVGDEWAEINQQQARDKVSHALRFASKSKDEKKIQSLRRRKQHYRGDSSASELTVEATTPDLLPEQPTHIMNSLLYVTAIEKNTQQGSDLGNQEFNALRSVDFDELMNDPLFNDKELDEQGSRHINQVYV